MDRRHFLAAGAAALGAGFALRGAPAIAKGKKYDPGASDSEIRLGQTIPYSGAGSVYGAVGHAQAAYFDELNEKGGINGRKIRFISLDDAYSPPKTMEATRRLVEQEEVLGLFSSLGTATQAAVQKYLNNKKVPQLLLNAGAPRWNNPKQFPWTTPGLPLYSVEGRILANYLAARRPGSRVAVLYQNDEFGRDYLKAFREGLGSRGQIVAEAHYDLTDATVDSQMINLARSGADVFFNASSGKFTSQAVKKAHELDWKPFQILISTSSGTTILSAAGAEAARGIVSAHYIKQLGSPQWDDDPGVQAFEALRAKRMPNISKDNSIAFIGYGVAVLMHQILERCGDELTRENLLRQATSLRGMVTPPLLPGLSYATTPEDYSPFNAMIMGTYQGDGAWDYDMTPVSAG
ncbi:ABC transporter substrate-binding protein [Camelimonas abortus]|uniref:ABC transporter substrate-binding protein n=1 Tax=Camelimonas abortus TaxID=1017184 RepID=A0ABV7LGF7_9HYPH